MKFSQRQVADPAAQENFDQLSSLLSGIRAIKIGSGTWTWPGGQAASSVVTVTHELNTLPRFVVAVGSQDQGITEAIIGEAFSYGDTTFGTRGVSRVGTSYAAGTTAAFVWLAIA